MKKPFDLLNMLIGKNVIVSIKGGKIFEGRMMAFDVHMNIILSNAKCEDKEIGNIFIRGDSVVYVHELKKEV